MTGVSVSKPAKSVSVAIQQRTASPGIPGTQGSPGVGVPAGGTTGQVLTKVDGSDYNTAWGDPGSASVAWGLISGTLASQTDLKNALDAKAAGPATSTDNTLARFDGATGKAIQGSGIIVSDTDDITTASGKLSIHGAESQYALNVKGTGLAARLMFQGSSNSDNPGIELRNGLVSNDMRALLCMAQTQPGGTSGGTQLELYLRPDAGGNVLNRFTFRHDGSLRMHAQTVSRIAIINASGDLVSASNATYPDLTELAFLKGVTSAIQTQINGKEASGTAEAAISTHLAAGDPHPQYLTQAEADALYSPKSPAVFIQPTQPGISTPYLWVDTSGGNIKLWMEDGT